MAADRSIEFDFDRIDGLIAEEEAALEPKHKASIAYRTIAERYIAGGVASSWQDSRPHAIFIDHGRGNRIYDIDGNVLLRWGGADAAQPGNFVAPHGIWVDNRGDIYMAEVTDTIGVRPGIVPEGTHTFQKFARV